ncbi:MAG: nucleotide exchange factor GrpE [Anaerolineales bacterium]|nr:nucleotide exchange factor GrpE [Anaerolineales bacterium]
MADQEQVTQNENGATQAEAAELSALEALQGELEAAKAKAAENLEGWQRTQAEFQNYKRRVERDRIDFQNGVTGKIIARYVDVQDDFDRAMKHQPAEGELAQWAQGIGSIYRKFQNVLEAEGVTRIEAEGQMFDPSVHEAVVHEASETHQSGQIIEVLRHGYKIGERVIRPALVKVAQ